MLSCIICSIVKKRIPEGFQASPGISENFRNATALLYQPQALPPAGFLGTALQPLPAAGWSAGVFSAVLLFSIPVPPAPAFSPPHAVAQPDTDRPAPAIIRPARNFLKSILFIPLPSFG
jgi:hypothetical protein